MAPPFDRSLPATLDGVPLRRGPPSHMDSRPTSWMLIQNAAGRQTAEARRGLVRLCAAYWPPVYSFLRRQGYDQRLARDLLRAFLALLIEKQYLLDAERRVGRFRCFLLAAIKRF